MSVMSERYQSLFSLENIKQGQADMKLARRQSGFSLLEVLFSVLVLTMGMVFVGGDVPGRSGQ